MKTELHETDELMRSLAHALDTMFNGDIDPKPYCFVLLAFKNGVAGRANYISNANRADVIKAIRETADRLEAKQDLN